jgi:site-specific DNA-methyltransferase (adenine-specific)
MLELNKIYFQDSLEGLKLIDDESINLICIDPPYFLLNNQKWDNQWKNIEEYLNWCKIWFNESFRILKKDGAFYCFQDWRLISEYVIELKKVFPYFQNWITWERIKGRSSKINWKSSKEEILYFSKSKQPKFFEQKKIRPVIAPYKDIEGKPKGWFVDEEGNRVRWTGIGNVWHYTPPVWSSIEEPPKHPTQKPLMMIERIINAHTLENDLILDFFLGSGTTCIAAKKLKRNFLGFENNKEYFNIACNRIGQI